ncbi:MAG: pyridoxal phosphate-dependent aminotransferase [Oligoflexia bacterium]
MTQRLASRVLGVSDSLTLKLNTRVQEMQRAGLDVVNLSTGEPDFAVPEAAKLAVQEALRLNRSKYTPVTGILELRERIARRTSLAQPTLVSAFGEWKASDVVVTNGGKQAIFNAMMALLEPEEEVLVPIPYWISYPEMAGLVGAKTHRIQTQFKNSFKLTGAELKTALDATSQPRILILNSPNNPTGALYTRSEFQEIGAVLESHPRGRSVWVISDEIYDRVILQDPASGKGFCSFLEACPGLRDRTITVNGMSKSAAMTGWRVGWSVSSGPVTAAMGVVQAQSTSGINALAQWASVAALDLPEEAFADQVLRYRARARLALEILQKAGKLEIVVPEGAFYLFFGVEKYLRAGEGTAAFCERVLNEARVAIVPGDPFGLSGFVRLSFATQEKQLEAGCRRLADFLEKG